MINSFTYNTDFGEITICEKDNFIIETVIGISSYNADRIIESPIIKKAYTQLDEYFKGIRKSFEIPLNPKGTEFQKKVWNSLLKIPYGSTCSYKDVAISIGNEKACRAVGSANNKNPIFIFIPCHRVISANGDIGGYEGGIKLKEKLLLLEKNNK